MPLRCGKCGGTNMQCLQQTRTMAWFPSPRGHNHDDNCENRIYACLGCGARINISKRNRCPVCDWVGKMTCFCHPGEKVDEWPDEEKGEHNATPK